jgi:hypothetical protein
MPLPPADFDPRFDHAAPPDQVLRGYVAGGELVSITSVRPDGGSYRFALPALAPEVVVRIGGERQTPRFVCDTVVIDCAAQRLWLVGRAATSVHGRIAELEWIKIQGPPGAGGADGGAVRA